MLKQARIRSESTVEQYSKRKATEGYDLWDKDYPLSALRFFIFKAETALPYQQGQLLDAVAELSAQLGSKEDARETYFVAADKYRITQQPLLTELMQVKMTEMDTTAGEALAALLELLRKNDPDGSASAAAGAAEAKRRSGLARCYAYLAELYLTAPPATGEDERAAATRAVEAATRAVAAGTGCWDRVHTAYNVLGEALENVGDLPRAEEAFATAATLCPHYVEALERLISLCEAKQDDADAAAHRALREHHLQLLERLLAAHPRADRVREKAFLVSELQGDAAALAYLDDAIARGPPQEEMESFGVASAAARATLHKARAAILADGGRLGEALAAAQAALAADANDEEAQKLMTDIQGAMKE
ncbi:hypothetical protein STCU_05026 [Strigomonas culicis]|uniref:Uncharacterized protein n=1 Tax=Strigomonas culicis TaxID=28005 RepID=S9UIK1_9TRYP|nr:hypothetical protein STCU_05026 [Strigomonas culicis]|eukprot:EPY28554.1 hypothetical protein STCU_05026 [Strigomonas culicis]